MGTSNPPRNAGRTAAFLLCAVALGATEASAQVRATHLYSLSSFAGRAPYDWAQIAIDDERDEIYVVYQNVVRIYNASGMEVYNFGDDLALGQVLDVAVDQDGDLVVLSYKESRPLITRCNYRGVPIGSFQIKNLPADIDFRPNRMAVRNGLFYFASTSLGSVVITSSAGEFREHLKLLSMVDPDERAADGAEMLGFSVDHEGNILFTVAVFFKAYKVAPDRKVTSFGRPGSTPGRFGIVAGIVSDSRGNILVADRLKSVVMAFDKNFRFITEFGARGRQSDTLVAPDTLAIDKRDRLYVTQGRRRGISVYALEGE